MFSVIDYDLDFKYRLTNVGIKQLTGIVVDLGKNDVQRLLLLDPGQSFYFYPKPDTIVNNVKVITNEGIHVQADYRSPTKTRITRIWKIRLRSSPTTKIRKERLRKRKKIVIKPG